MPAFSWDTVPVWIHMCNTSGAWNVTTLKYFAKYPIITFEKGQGVFATEEPYASKYAEKLIGVALSKESLAFAKKFVQSKNLELKQGNNLEIPIETATADIVVSDGVCHHTGDTLKAFSECVRILKNGGKLYLAVYKKFRYYPLVYYVVGGAFRVMNKVKIGTFLVENLFVNFHYLMYKMFKKQQLNKSETRNIFFDYFITPVATFQSKSDVKKWCSKYNCSIVDYSRTSGNCHVFVINKND